MDLFTVSWSPEDHIEELNKILQNAVVTEVEKRFVEYVVDSIEPAGWRARWRFDTIRNSPQNNNAKYSDQEYIVDVLNVSMDKLEASVSLVTTVSDFLETIQNDNISNPTEMMDCDGRNNIPDLLREAACEDNKLTVKLNELTPLVQQENDAVDVTTTAETIEQIRFFYHHIFYPWDTESEYCCFDEERIAKRYQLHQKMSGSVSGLPAGVSADMTRAKNEGWIVNHSIEKLEAASGINEGILYEDMVRELVELHQTLEGLKNRFHMLSDPIIREVSSRHLLSSLPCNRIEESVLNKTEGSLHQHSSNKVWLVGKTDNMAILQSSLKMIDRIVEQYPQCSSWPVSLSSRLQSSIDDCKAGDVIILMPGRHLLHSLGVMAQGGGVIRGVSPDVVLEGTATSGDVMMHISLGETTTRKETDARQTGFTLSNLTLEPKCHHNTAILVHSGEVTVRDVNILGNSCKGIVVTHSPENDTGGVCHVSGVTVRSCNEAALECRVNGKLSVHDTKIEDCGTGVIINVQAKVDVTESSIKSCCVALQLILDDTAVDPTSDQVDQLSIDQLLPCILNEYRGVTLEDNKKDLLMTYPHLKQEAC